MKRAIFLFSLYAALFASCKQESCMFQRPFMGMVGYAKTDIDTLKFYRTSHDNFAIIQDSFLAIGTNNTSNTDSFVIQGFQGKGDIHNTYDYGWILTVPANGNAFRYKATKVQVNKAEKRVLDECRSVIQQMEVNGVLYDLEYPGSEYGIFFKMY